MKPQIKLRALSAVAGGAAAAGMGVLAVVAGATPGGSPTATVLAPATAPMTVIDVATAATTTTTTSEVLSFRPTITASIPPPPT